MFGGPGLGLGLGPAQGQGLGPSQKTAPTPGLAVSSIKPKNTKKKGSSSTPPPAVDWTARMLDMKRINTLIRSKDEVTFLGSPVAISIYYPTLCLHMIDTASPLLSLSLSLLLSLSLS